MNHAQWTAPIVKQIQNEHHEQAGRIRQIGMHLCRQPGVCELTAALATLRSLLVELRTHLVEHFAREEHGGFLDEAIANMPRLAPVATTVEKEHPGLLAEIDGIIAALPGNKPTLEHWVDIGHRFRVFAQRINRHEALENRLLQEGLNEDFTMDF